MVPGGGGGGVYICAFPQHVSSEPRAAIIRQIAVDIAIILQYGREKKTMERFPVFETFSYGGRSTSSGERRCRGDVSANFVVGNLAGHCYQSRYVITGPWRYHPLRHKLFYARVLFMLISCIFQFCLQ